MTVDRLRDPFTVHRDQVFGWWLYMIGLPLLILFTIAMYLYWWLV